MATRILVVDDEADLRELIHAYLVKEGFEVFLAADGPSAVQAVQESPPDIVVLDVMLPGLDGFQVLQKIRQDSDVYVLMLTARAEEMDKVMGLAMGADDYLTKPFSPRELVARIQAIQRRSRGRTAQGETTGASAAAGSGVAENAATARAPQEACLGESPASSLPPAGAAAGEPGQRVLRFPHLRIDPARRTVYVESAVQGAPASERPVELTALEFDLLTALAGNPGIVLTRDQLIEKVWGYDFYGDERVVDVHIKELRKKLGDTVPPRLIKTVRGVGYKLEDPPPGGDSVR